MIYEPPPTEFNSLEELISFEGFRFDHYREDEKDILEPQLKELGYNVIEWQMGEYDSFGPLTRIVKTSRPGGGYVWFIYG